LQELYETDSEGEVFKAANIKVTVTPSILVKMQTCGRKNCNRHHQERSLMMQTAAQILILRVMTPTANAFIFAFSKCLWGKVTKCDILNTHLMTNHVNLCNPCWGKFWLQFKG